MLAEFDARVASAGFPLVRYSGDVVALVGSRDEAWEAMRAMSEAAGTLGMPLGADKSDVMSFKEGFCFLGEDFGPRYPPALSGHRVAEPARKVLYRGMQGAHAHLESGRLIVQSAQDIEVPSIPAARSSASHASARSGSARACAPGRLLVRWTWCSCPVAAPTSGMPGPPRRPDTGISRLRAQLSAADDPARVLPFARAVVDAKVRKQMVLLQRLARRDNSEIVSAAV